MINGLVKRRCVVMIGDYNPTDVAQQFAEFRQGLRQFAQTWSVRVGISQAKVTADGCIAVWHIEAKAPNWQVNTEFRLLNWSDLVSGDFRRWSLGRVWRAVKAFGNFIITGTCWRYLRSGWRFGVLFLYPALMFLLFAVLALWLAALLVSLNIPFAVLGAFLVAAALFSAFVKWLDPFDLLRIVDLWVFLYELVHLQRPGLAERLGTFSHDIASKLQSYDFDEIVVIGHAIGAALQPGILDQVFFALPEFGKGEGCSVNVLSLGSLLLSVGLHPEGTWVVPPTLRIATDRCVYWAEYQAQEDILSFFGSNPVTELLQEYGDKPIIKRIRTKDMTDTVVKSRLRGVAYQSHQQLIQANTKRYFYDYFMICCGPFSLPTRVKYPDRLLAAFAPDGRLVSSP